MKFEAYIWSHVPPSPVAGEDAVLGGAGLVLVEGAGRREVGTGVAIAADLAAVGAPVPPHPVAGVIGTTEEVAGREVLDRDVGCLVDLDAIDPRGGVGGPGRVRADAAGGRVRDRDAEALIGGVSSNSAAIRPWCRRS